MIMPQARGQEESGVQMKNDKKQLCKKCMYQGRVSSYSPYNIIREENATISCDYIGITGHARILECEDPKNCTVYKPKKAKKPKTPLRLKKQSG